MPFTATYTYQVLVDLAQRLVKGIPVSDIDEVAVDFIDAMIWNSYPWQWTRATLTSIPLVDATQDYAYSNTNLFKLLNTRITNTTTGPPYAYRDMRQTKWIEPFGTSKISWPAFQLICWDKTQDKLRLEAAVSVPTGTTLQLDGSYQKQHTKITALATTCVFPDHYAQVLVEGLLWFLYRFADDDRAGTVQYANGQAIYTGQLGIFMEMLQQMKDNEMDGIGDTIYPEDSIGGSAYLSPPSMFSF